jgi:hypothetical protein
MMFIIRTNGETPTGTGFTIRQTRRTPALASGGTHDFFCDGDLDAARGQGLNVVALHDGWWADDTGGGVAIWGQGRFWEIRDTPFTVRETCADVAPPAADPGKSDEIVNVRNAIFGV